MIVTHNDADKLDRCLKSVSRQNYPRFEIVIVDANSTDDSPRIATRYTSKVVRLKVNHLGYSRQIGVENASGSIVAVLDSDVVLPSDNWLSKAVNAFSAKERTAIVWPKNIGPSNSNVAKCFFKFWLEVMRYRVKNNRGTLAIGSNALYLKSAITEVGGYDIKSHYSEDVDLGRRILMRGYSYVFFEEPIIHYTNMSLGEFTRNQLWGARDYAKFGIGRLGITFTGGLFEHFVVGIRGMIKGMSKERDPSWLIYPLLLMIRVVCYIVRYLQHTISLKLSNRNKC